VYKNKIYRCSLFKEVYQTDWYSSNLDLMSMLRLFEIEEINKVLSGTFMIMTSIESTVQSMAIKCEEKTATI
jgi:hypothetical protein